MAANTAFRIGSYTVEWDGIRNWTVTKTVEATHPKAKGDTTEKFVGYYGTLHGAVLAIQRDSQGDLGEISLGPLVDSIRESERHILESLLNIRADLAEVPAERVA